MPQALGARAALGATVLAACLLVAPGATRAQGTAPPAQPAPDCGMQPTQADMNRCAQEASRAADARLAAAYRSVSVSLDAPQRDALRRAQKAWLGWRAAACDYEASAALGGSAAPMVRTRCAARMTHERAAELDRLGRCPEGDLGCPRGKS
jgi:uncharacterized protein YecT (DUF1311 family)